MLEIKNFSKSYKNTVKAVDNLTLTVEPGDIYAFIGHNGAGKTTTLKAIAGILDFEDGDIHIDGYSIRKDPMECKRRIAYTPDNPELYEHLTGIQYLTFIADVFGLGAEREERIRQYSDAFEMTPHLGDLISSYSHGMKQKIAMISGWIHDPKLFLLDEPFVGLDPKASAIVKEYMREKCRNGSAVFFSTHILEVAEKLCNKVAIISRGRLVVSGRMEDVLADQSLEKVFLEVSEHAE